MAGKDGRGSDAGDAFPGAVQDGLEREISGDLAPGDLFVEGVSFVVAGGDGVAVAAIREGIAEAGVCGDADGHNLCEVGDLRGRCPGVARFPRNPGLLGRSPFGTFFSSPSDLRIDYLRGAMQPQINGMHADGEDAT